MNKSIKIILALASIMLLGVGIYTLYTIRLVQNHERNFIICKNIGISGIVVGVISLALYILMIALNKKGISYFGYIINLIMYVISILVVNKMLFTPDEVLNVGAKSTGMCEIAKGGVCPMCEMKNLLSLIDSVTKYSNIILGILLILSVIGLSIEFLRRDK